MGHFFSKESWIALVLIVLFFGAHDGFVLHQVNKRLAEVNAPQPPQIIIAPASPAPTPTRSPTPIPPCKSYTTKEVEDFGGCDAKGVCGVEYTDGTYGKQFYPVYGRKYSICLKR